MPAYACREALLGTDSGAIYELGLDEGKKERLVKLHELQGETGPIAGLAQVGRPVWGGGWELGWPAAALRRALLCCAVPIAALA